MAQKLRAGIVGATGMVGQRFIALLDGHPSIEVVLVAASARSAGKPFAEAVGDRWVMPTPIPARVAGMVVRDAADVKGIAGSVDFIFCAVDMPREETAQLEEAYARAEVPVVSNNSALRGAPDVPMIVPEVNPGHVAVIPAQRKRLGTRRGFIAVKPNCSLQSYVPAVAALREFGPTLIAVTTYQALSGAGKTFASWPEMTDNVIPFIKGEEEKSEQEPLKIFGTVRDGAIVPAAEPVISAQCLRVAAADGHMAAVFIAFAKNPSREDILARWKSWETKPQALKLPSAPTPFLIYHEDESRPQTRLDRDAGKGMAVSLGRLRPDALFGWRFVGLSHNTVRGAAGGAILTAELLAAEGFLTPAG